jgi:prolyl 4-hydroxylase
MLIEAGFLLEAELIELVNLIRKFSRPTPQQNWDLGECGSSTVALSSINSVAVARVERRLQDRLGIASNYGEGLRGVKYEPGQGYRIHHDSFTQGNEQWDEFVGARGNRTWTAMIYCNTLSGGGATVFPELGVRIEPRAGMLVAWSNLKHDRTPDMDLLHTAEPHRAAEKFIVTQWFRELT